MASTASFFKGVFSPQNGKLVLASLVIGFLSALLALMLKHVTDHYENILFEQSQTHLWYLLIFPAIGLSMLYFFRQHLFKKKANKGITEIFESIQTKAAQFIYPIAVYPYVPKTAK